MKKSDTEAERVARAELEEKIGKQIAEWAIAAERRGSSRISWPARLGRFLRNVAGTSWSKSEQAGKILQPQEESTELRLAALAYVLELYNELSAENVAPTLGTQNQVVEFILADPELRQAVMTWAAESLRNEATLMRPQRLRGGVLYDRVRGYIEQIMGPAFKKPGQLGR